MSTENKKNIVKMATIYAQEGKWDKAIGEYKKLITLDPTDYNVHNMLGDAHSKKGEDAFAYQEYIVAAEAYIKQGLADKAQIIYKKIGRLDSEKLPEKDRQKQILVKKHTIAEKFIEGGEIDKAIETYKEIIKLSPANFETYQKLGELYAEKGDKPAAQEYYRKIVDVYFKNRLYKKALPIYQKILEMQPDDISAREKIAEIYEREANESDAKREYLLLAEHYWKEKNIEKTDFFAQKAVEFKSIEAHYFKGAALYERKELGEAKKELEMLLKFKANHAQALTTMACIFRDMGQMDEALAGFDKVIKAEPENTDALEELAGLYEKKGLSKEAITRYMTAVNVLNSKQSYDKSAAVLNKALALEPANIDTLSKLGDVYAKQNKKKEAADTYIKISEIYKKENMADKAAEYYKMAQNVDPGNTKIVDAAKKMTAEPPPAPKAEVKPPPPAPPKTEVSASAQGASADKKPAAPPAATVKPEIKQEPPAFKITHTGSSFGQKPAAPAGEKPAAPRPEPKPMTGEPTIKIQSNSAAYAPSKPDTVKAAPDKPATPPAQPPSPDFIKIPADKKKEEDIPISLPDIDLFGLGGKKPPEKSPVTEKAPSDFAKASAFDKSAADKPLDRPPPPAAPAPKTMFVPQGPSEDDIPSLIAMGDSYARGGSFDEAIDMYQKALAMDPGNMDVKKKLTAVYSKYAGMPVSGAPDLEAKKKEEEARKKAEEEAKKKRDAEDKKKKEEEEKRKKEEEARKKKEEEEKKKKDDEARKKADEEAKKKKEEEEKKRKEEEAKKKREEEESKKKAAPAHEDEAVDDEYSDDFVTVTTAEIFIKQGLFTEADKILNKILKKDPANIEAKMKLDEMKKLSAETEQKGENVMDEDVKKGKQSKVTYI